MSPLSGEYTSPVRWSDVSARVRNNRELGWRRHIMRTIDMIELALLIIQVTLFVLRHIWWVIRLHPVAWQTTGCMSPVKKMSNFLSNYWQAVTIDYNKSIRTLCADINSPEVPPTCHRGHFYFMKSWQNRLFFYNKGIQDSSDSFWTLFRELTSCWWSARFLLYWQNALVC